jgi:hypothetical protein
MTPADPAHEINRGALRLDGVDVTLKLCGELDADTGAGACFMRNDIAVGVANGITMMITCNNWRRCEHGNRHDRNGNNVPSSHTNSL